MTRKMVLCLLGLALSGLPLSAQVRQATPADTAPPPAANVLKEVPSPMLIEFSLGAGNTPSGKPRASFLESKPEVTRAYSEGAGYVCDKARIPVILVRREEHHGSTTLEVTPSLSTDYLRQDVNLTVMLLSQGKEVRRQFWDHLTIGAQKGAAVTALGQSAMGIGTSHSKAPTASWSLTGPEWEALWKDGTPSVRVVLDIQ
jgi:hypothetical protein